MQEILEQIKNNKKNEKGFAIVLALVLLLVMSLMGGTLIVMSSSDHQNNNLNDEYQQTFYVAEAALIEGEKYLINQYLGPWDKDTNLRSKNRNINPISLTCNFYWGF
jgi:Tfp pilus assembly protein PilX